MLQAEWDGESQKAREWDVARDKAMVINHPLYPELLTAHAACLRVGTPVDQLPHIETQLAQAHLVTQKYSVLNPDDLNVTYEEKFELDHVMVYDRCQKLDFYMHSFPDLALYFVLC